MSVTSVAGVSRALPTGDVLLTLPFFALLLSIALFPLLAARVWERHFVGITMLWTALFVAPFVTVRGGSEAAHVLIHTLAFDYIPFLLLMFSLFTVSGGIRLVGNLVGDPRTNLTILGCGTLLASVLGTTGAAMLLIRPLIQANEGRRNSVHVFVFFIFLVGNVGGALTPLGDPPLFLGFLRGVDFLWTFTALLTPTLVASGLLLALFLVIDSYRWRTEPHAVANPPASRGLRVEGGHNAIFLAAIVVAVLISGLWHPGIDVPVGAGVTVSLEGLTRDIVLLVAALLSWLTTPQTVRIENAFTWVPIREVAILFLGLFVTIVPVLALLRAGHAGPAAPLLEVLYDDAGRPIDWAFFWMTGLLSSVLDNAPTYLVFFNLAGGDPQALMTDLHRTLVAISMGAVFMGGNSYLGNAPNFMIKAICEEQGVKMPGFFGYLAWSGSILLPLFALLTVLFLR